MGNVIEQIKKYYGVIADLFAAESLLGWDQQVYMPHDGAEGRGDALATIQQLSHQKYTSDELGALIEKAEKELAGADGESDDVRMVRVLRREYDRRTKVTSEWVGEFAKATIVGQTVWQDAKAKSDFKLFEPELRHLVELRRQYADFFKPYTHVYDPLLNEFEPGMKTKDVQAIFAILRERQVEILKKIMSRPQVDDSFLTREYPEQGQWDFGVEVLTKFGFNWQTSRQDRSVHPFTTSMSTSDVRITTRFDKERAASALFSTMHEGGHALYDGGFAKKFYRTPLATGASYAVHESQSRMWENLIGRSLSFWKHFYPRFQHIFADQVGNLDLATFYKGINKVEPSLIRVEADEATYNLHIMLRLEIEIALMEGSLQVKDLPEAWNDRMKEYLGVTPPNDAKGVLQDVHWSSGLMGYFPTYALGNLISVQLWERINRDIPRLAGQIEKGNFSELLGWLRANIHQEGAKYEPQELVQKVTGSKIDPNPYLNYLETKYQTIYNY